MTARKRELCNAALDYLLTHGVANVSLRPLAASLGTSPRILMFHFHSKEGLLRAVFQELHAQLQQSFSQLVGGERPERPEVPIKLFWTWATRNKNAGARLKLLYELQIIAIQNPAAYGRYLQKSSLDWQALTLGALSEGIRDPSMSTLCVAVFDGLFIEFISTGNRRRTSQALDRFIEIVRSRKKSPRP